MTIDDISSSTIPLGRKYRYRMDVKCRPITTCTHTAQSLQRLDVVTAHSQHQWISDSLDVGRVLLDNNVGMGCTICNDKNNRFVFDCDWFLLLLSKLTLATLCMTV